MWSCTAEWLRHRRQINEAKPMLITALESFRWRQARSSVSAPELSSDLNTVNSHLCEPGDVGAVNTDSKKADGHGDLPGLVRSG